MLRKLIPLAMLILSGSAMAQMGVGTKTPADSAQLDVVTSNKGVLLPRVELVAIDVQSPIVGEMKESLLVYHVGNTTLPSGFYYWKGNKWVRLSSEDSITDRMNNSFTIGANPNLNGEESLIITDTKNHSVYLAITSIANNGEFVTNLIDNQNFITQLANKEEFITNIINELKNSYENVTYENGAFYVTHEVNGQWVKELIDLTTVLQGAGESLITDGVIGILVDGVVETEVEKAVLKSLKLTLNNNAITSAHIQDGTIKPIDMEEAEPNKILITGVDRKPVWKDRTQVAPNFFYMPAVIFDTSVTGTATRDLYQEYVNQFTGGSKTVATAVSYPISHGPAGTVPMIYSGGIVGSIGAPADISVLSKGDMYYYVTYYDEEVFENLSISADGKLTYKVKANALPNSYMNIVFVLK